MSSDVLKSNQTGHEGVDFENTVDLIHELQELGWTGEDNTAELMTSESIMFPAESEYVSFEDDLQDEDAASASQASELEAAIADEIASAVSDVFQQEDKIAAAAMNASPDMMTFPFVETPDPDPVPDEEPAESAEEAELDPQETDPAASESAPEKTEAPREATEAPRNQTEPQAEKRPAPKQKRSAPPKKEKVHNPGTDYVKITRSNVTVSPKEYIASTFAGVFDRQKEALPPVGVNLRDHEKKKAVYATLHRMLNPVRIAIFVLMVLCIAGRKFPWMTLGFMKGMNGVFVALILTIAAMIICWESTWRGIRDLLYLRFSHETYLLIGTLVAFVDVLYHKNETSLLPFLTMSWCVLGMGAKMDAQADLRALRAVITDRAKTGIRIASGLWEKRDVMGKAPSGTAGFVRHQAEPDVWHTVYNALFIPLIILATVASAYVSAKMELKYLTVLSTLFCISMPVSLALSCSRGYLLLSLVLSGKGVVAGWFGIKSMAGKKSVLIYDNDLFPKGTMGHKGVKCYGRMTAIELVSLGASLVLKADIGLDDVFIKYARDIGAVLQEVSHLQLQEGGVEGRILGSRVQFGTYQYMQLMGVEMPRKGSTNGMYIAIDGKLQGLFAIKYTLQSGAIAGFHRFVREKRLTSLVATKNFTINPAFIERSFKAPITRLICPKTGRRRKLANTSIFKGTPVLGYVLKEGVSCYSRVIGGARRVYRNGLILSLASGFLSVYLMIDTISALASGLPVIEAPRLLLLHLLMFLVVEVASRLSIRE